MEVGKVAYAIPQNMLQGDIIPLHTSDKGHWSGVSADGKIASDAESFYSLLSSAFERVNDKQIEAEELSIQAVAKPDSVQMHDVLIAQEEARISLTYAKTIVDQAVKAYRELTNLR